jgi:predicted alpha-1,6-mannanase (GH76 family)
LADYRSYAATCIEALQSWYNWDTGLWESTGWWNAANALHAVIDYASLTKRDSYHAVLANTFQRHERGKFLNHYYDDEGWWALAWIRAFDLTHEKYYLDMAESIFSDMCTGWDDVCGGGLWWNKDRKYKNAITNELFFSVAARLFTCTGNETYFNYAEDTWRWFQKSGLINEQHLINDGLKDCHNNGQPTWTYNQGVILGALIEMFGFYLNDGSNGEGDIQFIIEATHIADATIKSLTDQFGILADQGEEHETGGDGPQFKGIFIRNLATLYHAIIIKAHMTAEPYRQFIFRNADSIWQNNRTEGNKFGLRWSGPVDKTDAARQTSALEAFNAAISLDIPH